MSQQNVEFVKALIAGTEPMDKQALLAIVPEWIAQACDPNIEWVEDPQRAAGKIGRFREFYDEHEALKAVGLAQ